MKKCPFCAEDIQDAAIVCKHCGRELSSTNTAPQAQPARSQSNAAVLLVILVIIVAAITWMTGGFSIADETGRAVMPQPIGAAAPIVTKAQFDQIKEGMTYDQVRAIIGAAGELQSSSDLAGIKTVMYSWMNANGSNMNAMFQNDRLIQKAQFGLP